MNTEWISVDERLPEVGVEVLTYNNQDEMYVRYVYKGRHSQGLVWSNYSWLIDDIVLFWMTLPDKPEIKND